MIRKAVIIVLTLAAAGTAAVYAASVFWLGYYNFDSGGYSTVACFRGALMIVHDFRSVSAGFHLVYDPSVELVGIPYTHKNSIIVPLWIPLVVFGVYPTIAFIRGPVRRWRRRRKGLCLKCAYNLTGNVTGVCPECGMCVE
jgi:hypothetical protein